MFACDLGDGVALRLYEERDAEEVYGLIEVNREVLARWMPWAHRQTLRDTREFIAQARRRWVTGEAVETAIVVDGAIVGGAGLNRIDRANRAANVGYWLAADAQGRGVMTWAVAGLLDHGFGALELHRIELLAGTENARSRAVAERLGFTREGVLRDAEWVTERWVDHVVHSMLADEWAQRTASR